MNAKQYFSGFLFAVLAATTMVSISQTTSPALTGNSLLTSWLVAVGTDSRARVLVVSGAAPKADGGLQLTAAYGWSDAGSTLSPVRGEVNLVSGRRELTFVTQSETKVVVTERDDGSFQGSYVLKNGFANVVTISRMPDGTRSASIIQKPGPDVPASCAAFSGGWSGNWPFQGLVYLWVASIDSNCAAKVVYTRGPNPPKSASDLKAATIKENVLTWKRPDGGITTFHMSGNYLYANYAGPAGNNQATMERFVPENTPLAATAPAQSPQ